METVGTIGYSNSKMSIVSPRARHPGMRSQVGLRKHHWNKDNEGYEIPVELFQILKDDAVKVLQSICLQICKIAVATGLEKMFSFQSQSLALFRLPKEFSDYQTIVLISHASKIMLKILQARLQQYVN